VSKNPRNRCIKRAAPFVLPNDGSDLKGGDANELVRVANPAGNVSAGTGTGDVRDCLDAHERFNRWAVGILSTENIGNNGNREFRYVKVDGLAPTLLNAHAGRWTHASERSMQWLRSYDGSLRTTNAGRVLAFIALRDDPVAGNSRAVGGEPNNCSEPVAARRSPWWLEDGSGASAAASAGCNKSIISSSQNRRRRELPPAQPERRHPPLDGDCMSNENREEINELAQQ
jgi:hypothetical protein